MTLGIIGYGRFGKLWAKHLSRFGRVLVYDKSSTIVPKGKIVLDKNISRVSLNQAARTDMLFLLVPISEMENCCREIKNKLSPNTLVVDACSVKIYPAKIMKAILKKRQPIIATHPLFGPDSAGQAKTLAGFKIAVCPVKTKKFELAKFEHLLKKLGLKIFRTTAKNHDKQMAKSQALVHFIGRGLEGLSLKPQEIATPDYLSLLNIRDMVVHDTWQLFLDMEIYNPFAKKIWKKFLVNLGTISQQIAAQKQDINLVRNKIDELDEFIIRAIAQRMVLAKKVGALKKRSGLKVLDKNRERQLAKFHRSLSQKQKLDHRQIDKIFSAIMDYSKKAQYEL